MSTIIPEENGVYGLNCSKAVWATGAVNESYHAAGLSILKDADFVIETAEELLIVEYKNAKIPNAANPDAFRPAEDRTIDSVARKYYDTLHYLSLTGKQGPKRYIFVVEAPNSDSVMRARCKEKLASKLPFRLQQQLNTSIRLIESVDVLSMQEWNQHERYGDYPFEALSNDEQVDDPR